jgi:hypothetical protein
VSHGLVLLPALEGFEQARRAHHQSLVLGLPGAARARARRSRAGMGDAQQERALDPALLVLRPLAPAARLAEALRPRDPGRNPAGTLRLRRRAHPVYLLWSRQENDSLLQPYREFWGQFAASRVTPAFTNLKDDSVDSHGGGAGIRAIAQVVAEYPRLSVGRLPRWKRASRTTPRCSCCSPRSRFVTAAKAHPVKTCYKRPNPRHEGASVDPGSTLDR